MDPDVQRVSGDAIVLMARVSCLFLDLLARKAFVNARQVGLLTLLTAHTTCTHPALSNTSTSCYRVLVS
jgi:hypothetical protein